MEMWKYFLILCPLLSLLFCPVKADIVLDPTPLYDFANGCPGLINIGLPAYTFAHESYNGDVYVISVITHQVMKLSEDDNGVFQCSIHGYLPTGPAGVPLGASFSLGMDIDPSGNIYVSNTGSGNPTGGYGSVWKISSESNTYPIEGVKIFTSTATTGRPTGISVIWRQGFLLLSSATDGIIYKIALDGSYNSVWASATNSVYSLLSGTGQVPGASGTIHNTNLFGVPFGGSASDVSVNGKTLYVGSADRGVLISIEINDFDGSAGATAIVGESFEHTIEGVCRLNGKIYLGSVFANGTDLSPDVNGVYDGGVLPGGSVWIVDLQTGFSSRFYDARLGCVCSVGKAKGVVSQGQNKILISSSGFDNFPGWPLGLVRAGVQPYPSGGIDGTTAGPAWANVAYNAKIWVASV